MMKGELPRTTVVRSVRLFVFYVNVNGRDVIKPKTSSRDLLPIGKNLSFVDGQIIFLQCDIC